LKFIGKYIKFTDIYSNEMDPGAGMSPDGSFDNTGGNKIVKSKMNEIPDDQPYNSGEGSNESTPF